MSEQERLKRAAEFGRQQAVEVHAKMEAMRVEAASLGFDGVAAIQAAFAAAPPVIFTPAEKLFGPSAVTPIRPRPRLVYSRD